MASLGDDELIALCDYRAASRRARRRFERVLTQFDPQGPPVRECPRHPDSRGGLFDYFWRTRDRIYGDRLAGRPRPSRPQGAPPIAVFVHNHTLLVDWRQRVLELTRLGRTVIVDGFSPVRNALAPVVVNGGPWQRTITPVQFARLRAEHGLSDAELLRALRPEHLPPCYGFVRIEPYDDTPALPAIRYWRQAEGAKVDGAWEMAAACGRQARDLTPPAQSGRDRRRESGSGRSGTEWVDRREQGRGAGRGDVRSTEKAPDDDEQARATRPASRSNPTSASASPASADTVSGSP